MSQWCVCLFFVLLIFCVCVNMYLTPKYCLGLTEVLFVLSFCRDLYYMRLEIRINPLF